MSNLEPSPQVSRVGGTTMVAAQPVHEVFDGRDVVLGADTRVRRLLPNLGRRMVGAWCFVDHYGPDDITAGNGMQVPPHPHLGLQTVSWLVDGEVHHRDSLGNSQLIRPGELGVMTAGHAIAHAEQSPEVHPRLLHGAQLWIALPDNDRNTAAAWQHETALPTWHDSAISATVFVGDVAGARSPARTYSPLVGIDIEATPGGATNLALEPDFEHAALVMSGKVEVDGVDLAPGAMLYLGCNRRELRITARDHSRLLLLGGEPFGEEIVMWWNFVARAGEEIAAARDEWMSGERFGTVVGYEGDPVPAPAPPAGTLKPGGSVRRR